MTGRTEVSPGTRELVETGIPVHNILGIRLLELFGDGVAKLLLPFRPEFRRRHRHGGRIALALDSAGGVASITGRTSNDDQLAGVDLPVDSLRPDTEGNPDAAHELQPRTRSLTHLSARQRDDERRVRGHPAALLPRGGDDSVEIRAIARGVVGASGRDGDQLDRAPPSRVGCSHRIAAGAGQRWIEVRSAAQSGVCHRNAWAAGARSDARHGYPAADCSDTACARRTPKVARKARAYAIGASAAGAG